MKKYKKVKETVEREECIELTCNVCKKTYKFENGQAIDCDKNDAIMEIQEFHHINFSGGYGSIFGDCTVVTADICQHCLKEKLGEYLKFEEHFGGF